MHDDIILVSKYDNGEYSEKKKKKNFFCTKIGYFYCKFGAKHTPFSLFSESTPKIFFKILQDDRVLKVKEGDNSE